MDRVEELIRESLQTRALDVEPTPALWREVDRRVVARRRYQVLTWSLAGAAAALAGILVVPLVADQVGGTGPDLEIPPLAPVPVAGAVPDTYVVDVDGQLELRDLRSGDPIPVEALEAMGATEAPARELEVRPGSTRDDYAVLAVRGGVGDGASRVELLDGGDPAGGTEGVRRGASVATALAPGAEDEPSFLTSVVWAPDQDAAIVTAPATGDDGTVLRWWDTPSAEDLQGEGDWPEAGPIVLDRDVELLDWVGATSVRGDESVLVLRDAQGRLVAQTIEVQGDGTLAPGETRELPSGTDVASSHAVPGTLAAAEYTLARSGDTWELAWSADGDRHTTTTLPDGLGTDGEPWLDAKQDAALVGNGSATWLVAHDGDGEFLAPVELGTGGRAALFDRSRPGAAPTTDEPDPAPPTSTTTEPVPGDTSDPRTSAAAPATDDAAPSPSPLPAPALPAPLVTVGVTDLVLHGPDGEQVLTSLPAEGESSFLSVAVRPGSSPDELTVVALHLAEGMQDLRTYRLVDGELSVDYWPQQYQVGFGGEAGDAVAAYGPVWHPSGDKLAWVETGTSGTPVLRVVGWTEAGVGTGDTADDHASFSLDELVGMEPEPVDWVDLGEGRTEIRAVTGDGASSWITLPIEIQGDDAAARSGRPEFHSLASGGQGAVGGLAGSSADGPRWVLQDGAVRSLVDRSVVVPLPPAFFAAEGIPDPWMRALGDGVLVGMSNTGTAYHVTGDGEISRVGGDGILDGDVIR
ncbi:hypothetical protein [Egicoccus halophilus]|uniref:Uncharacterized protein n=1 Tax=Egicoccus halophilus TaxID=1670830 RepID=A0A8J3A5M2_9ACTN|nr:hypothetical protein [Egicoccus halophilus]GGI03693.1 hypothetical protein GCM10011354_05310 [Egicoccus halophilus]